MTEKEQQVIENALNGASYKDIAAAFDMTDEDVMSLVAFMLQIVAEFQATGSIIYFDCSTIDAAIANKLKVLDVLAQLRLWDDLQRPIVKMILSGAPLDAVQAQYPVDRGQVSEWLNSVMIRIAAHLKGGDLDSFTRNRAAWVKSHISQVMDIIDMFTSWQHGKQLKNITFSAINTEV